MRFVVLVMLVVVDSMRVACDQAAHGLSKLSAARACIHARRRAKEKRRLAMMCAPTIPFTQLQAIGDTVILGHVSDSVERMTDTWATRYDK